jgi:hypothetical protein
MHICSRRAPLRSGSVAYEPIDCKLGYRIVLPCCATSSLEENNVSGDGLQPHKAVSVACVARNFEVSRVGQQSTPKLVTSLQPRSELGVSQVSTAT